MSFRKIPWPVLKLPKELKLEDITEENIQIFLKDRQKMLGNSYKKFWHKTQLRMHNDKTKTLLQHVVATQLDTVKEALKTVTRGLNTVTENAPDI